MAQVVRGCAYRALQRANRLTFLVGTLGIRPRLILKNKEKTARYGFTSAYLLDKLQIILLHQPALLIGFLRHLTAHGVHMAGNVRPACQYLELQLNRADF